MVQADPGVPVSLVTLLLLLFQVPQQGQDFLECLLVRPLQGTRQVLCLQADRLFQQDLQPLWVPAVLTHQVFLVVLESQQVLVHLEAQQDPVDQVLQQVLVLPRIHQIQVSLELHCFH